MKILALADKECKALWDPSHPQALGDIDVILSCGDLHPHYLSFIATYTHAPVFYVHGNHDGCYHDTPPLGCVCVEDRIYTYRGLRILGLGGSLRYNNGAHQFTQDEMTRRIRCLRFALWRNHGFDILLSHAPPFGLGDDEDRPHQGFHAFRQLIDRYTPYAVVHGHNHLNYGIRRERVLHHPGRNGREIQIINAYERYLFPFGGEQGQKRL